MPKIIRLVLSFLLGCVTLVPLILVAVAQNGAASPPGVVIRSYPHTISHPLSITTGPDGALWFTNSGNDSIGRITTSGAVTNYMGGGVSIPLGITLGPDGALWFTNLGNNSIGRITTSGSVTNYTDSSISSPQAISVGPDGALWFANAGNGSIGRITTGGSVTNYTDSSISTPRGITTGPDGDLWFTNDGNNSIGRITTGGSVTNYTDSSIANPQAITTGPDDALWFANDGNDSIGRITTSGAVTHYTGVGISVPRGITTGPDGALWFTNGNGSIGRITASGSVTNYTGTGIANSQGITTGPDGALWFANEPNSSIGRITTDGSVTNYTGGGVSSPQGITAGPDGALWFTNDGNNSIGRITTGGSVTNYTDSSIANPQAITTGPDGALWFTNSGNDSIGRITTSGAVIYYTGVGISSPQGITTGSDGALWFTNPGDSSIGRITTSGSVTNYAGPGIAIPQAIAAGPDGALWFTNHVAPGSIGRITTDGSVTSYPARGVSYPSYPTGITTGSDGALWFTNEGPNSDSIGRMTITGTVTNYFLELTSSGITTGPDGALWFTSSNGISRLTTGGSITDYHDTSISDAREITTGPGGALWFTNHGNNSIGQVLVGPSITSASSSTFALGSPDSFTVKAVGTAPIMITENGALPSGLSFVDNGDGMATLSGTPGLGAQGMYPVTIIASNGVSPDATQGFTLTVGQAPAITSASSTTFTVGSPGSFTVTTTGDPPPSISFSGTLPSGVNLVDNGDGTATLSGTPSTGTQGSHLIGITASNGVPPEASQSFTLKAKSPPTISVSPNFTNTGLPQLIGNKVTTVKGTGFSPGEILEVSQCGPRGCDTASSGAGAPVTVTVGSKGIFSVHFEVAAGVIDTAGDLCGTAPFPADSCIIRAVGSMSGLAKEVDLGLKAPTMSLKGISAKGALGNQTVAVVAKNFPIHDSLSAELCTTAVLTSQSANDCDPATAITGTTGVGGTVGSSTFPWSAPMKLVFSNAPYGSGGYSDPNGGRCGPPPMAGNGSCVIAVTDVSNTALTLDRAFSVQTPAFTIRPTTFPDTNSTRTGMPSAGNIHASGFPIGDSVVGLECAPNVVIGSNQQDKCDLSNLVSGAVQINGIVLWSNAATSIPLPILTENTSPSYSDASGDGVGAANTPSGYVTVDDANNQLLEVYAPIQISP